MILRYLKLTTIPNYIYKPNFTLFHKNFSNNSLNENKTLIRVRFAPSPTGKLHIGGLRTALYNFLFARKHKGYFILRIEDTDQERLKKDSLSNIIESLQWSGINPDFGPHITRNDDLVEGGPWIQSKRLDIYNHYANKLIESGQAYKCFCDEIRLNLLRRHAQKKQEKSSYDGKCRHLSQTTIQKYLNEGKPYVIRFKLEDIEVSFNDLTTGIHTSNPFNQEGDFIIVKSDKFPTYHFANVIDDHLMKITHVFRGQEWQLSTAKHILMYRAFGWQAPVYSHLPLICNSDGSKISKRQNDIDVLSYKDRGYLPETLLSYLSTIGGGFSIKILDQISSFNDTSEVINFLIDNFDEKSMNSKSIKLNQELLDSLNKKFIQLRLKSNDLSSLKNQLKSLLISKFSSNHNLIINDFYLSESYLNRVIEWSKTRINRINELVDNEKYLFLWTDMSNFTNQNSNLVKCELLQLVETLKKFLDKPCTNIDLFQNNALFKRELSSLFNELKKINSNNKKVNYWKMTRLIFTGNEEGPPIAEIFVLLEKENLMYRLNIAENFIKNKFHN